MKFIYLCCVIIFILSLIFLMLSAFNYNNIIKTNIRIKISEISSFIIIIIIICHGLKKILKKICDYLEYYLEYYNNDEYENVIS